MAGCLGQPLKVIVQVRQVDEVQAGEYRSSIHLAEAAIQREAASALPCGVSRPAAGPQKAANGNSPRSRLISVRNWAGWE